MGSEVTDYGDADLVQAIRAGDRAAVEVLYDRYAAPLHDFCYSMTRNPHDADDAVQDTFVAAMQKIGSLREPSRLRPWLYAIARHEVFAQSRRRKRTVVTDEMPEYASPAAGPDDAVGDAELVKLVWAAAAGLAERDRALLDLHVRQGLDGGDLAAAMGVPPAHAYVMLNRLRGQVERSLGALLVARTGRSDCAELAAIVGTGSVEMTPLLRKRIARHVESCETCEDRRRRMVSPMALFGAVAPVLAVPFALRAKTVAAMHTATSSPAVPLRLDHDGFPRTAKPVRRAVAGGTAVAAAAGVAVVLLSTSGGGAHLRSAASVLPNNSPSSSPSASSVPTTRRPTPTATSTPTPNRTETPTPSSAPTTVAGPQILTVATDDDHVVAGGNECPSGHPTTFVRATLGAGATSANVHWDLLADTVNGRVPVATDDVAMTQDMDGVWTARIGPFPQQGTVYYQVNASDSNANTTYGKQLPLPVQEACIL